MELRRDSRPEPRKWDLQRSGCKMPSVTLWRQSTCGTEKCGASGTLVLHQHTERPVRGEERARVRRRWIAHSDETCESDERP